MRIQTGIKDADPWWCSITCYIQRLKPFPPQTTQALAWGCKLGKCYKYFTPDSGDSGLCSNQCWTSTMCCKASECQLYILQLIMIYAGKRQYDVCIVMYTMIIDTKVVFFINLSCIIIIFSMPELLLVHQGYTVVHIPWRRVRMQCDQRYILQVLCSCTCIKKFIRTTPNGRKNMAAHVRPGHLGNVLMPTGPRRLGSSEREHSLVEPWEPWPAVFVRKLC